MPSSACRWCVAMCSGGCSSEGDAPKPWLTYWDGGALRPHLKHQGAAKMNNHEDIRDKLAKLEALFARGATPGERAAAGAALGRMQARLDLAGANASEPEIELQYRAPRFLTIFAGV